MPKLKSLKQVTAKKRTAVQVEEPWYTLLNKIVSWMHDPDARPNKQTTIKGITNTALRTELKNMLANDVELRTALRPFLSKYPGLLD